MNISFFKTVKKFHHRFTEDHLLRGTIIFSGLNLVGGVFSLLTQSYMGRNLSKDEFGLINTIFSISMLMGIFLSAYAYWIVEKYAENKNDLINNLTTLYHNIVFMIGVAVGIAVGVFVFKEKIYSWFKFENPNLLGLFILNSLIAFTSIPLASYFQSVRSFWVYSLGGLIIHIFKFFFIIIFLLTDLGIENAYFSFVVSHLMALCFGVFCLVKKVSFANLTRAFINIFRTKIKLPKDFYSQAKEFLKYFSSAFIFIAISNLDIVLIRYLLPPEISGDYAGASLIGKAFYFLSGVFIDVFYPEVVKIKKEEKSLSKVLNEGLIISLIIGVSSFIFIYFFSPFINAYFFSDKFANIIYLTRLYALFVSIMIVNLVYINFFIALKKFFFIFILLLFPIIQFVAIYYRIKTALEVIQVNITVAIILLIIFVFYHINQYSKNKK